MRIWYARISLVFALIIWVTSACGWCEDGTVVGNYQVALTSKWSCDSQCVKSGASNKIYSFNSTRLGESSSEPANARVFCGDTLMRELHALESPVICSAGESIRIAYDNDNADMDNHIEGIITVTEEPTPMPTSIPTSTPMPTQTSTPNDPSWIPWVVGSVGGVTILSVASTVGGYYIYKYVKSRRTSPTVDVRPLLQVN